MYSCSSAHSSTAHEQGPVQCVLHPQGGASSWRVLLWQEVHRLEGQLQQQQRLQEEERASGRQACSQQATNDIVLSASMPALALIDLPTRAHISGQHYSSSCSSQQLCCLACSTDAGHLWPCPEVVSCLDSRQRMQVAGQLDAAQQAVSRLQEALATSEQAAAAASHSLEAERRYVGELQQASPCSRTVSTKHCRVFQCPARKSSGALLPSR